MKKGKPVYFKGSGIYKIHNYDQNNATRFIMKLFIQRYDREIIRYNYDLHQNTV